MNIEYLFAANVVIWIGIGGYLAFLASRQAALSTRVKRKEMLSNGRDRS